MNYKKIIPIALVAISCSLLASVGMSVAWYSNGSYLRLSNVEVSLMSEPELGLGLTYSDNKNDYHFGEFPYDELPKMKSGYSDVYEEGQESDINGFVPVSAMFSKEWIGKNDENGLIDPIFYQNYKHGLIIDTKTYQKTSAAISGFYSVPMYLYCDRDMYVSIDSKTTGFAVDEKKNLETAKELHEKDDKYSVDEYVKALAGVVNSLRFSIYDCETYKYWIIDPYKGDTTTYYGGTLDLDGSGSFDTYYDSDNKIFKEFLFGEYQDPENIVYTDEPIEDTTTTFNAFSANHVQGAQTVDMDYYLSNNLIAKEESYTPEELSKGDMIAMKNHVPHRIVLSIYIEGWDRDNTSVSAMGSFFSSIKFKLTRQNFDASENDIASSSQNE